MASRFSEKIRHFAPIAPCEPIYFGPKKQPLPPEAQDRVLLPYILCIKGEVFQRSQSYLMEEAPKLDHASLQRQLILTIVRVLAAAKAKLDQAFLDSIREKRSDENLTVAVKQSLVKLKYKPLAVSAKTPTKEKSPTPKKKSKSPTQKQRSASLE